MDDNEFPVWKVGEVDADALKGVSLPAGGNTGAYRAGLLLGLRMGESSLRAAADAVEKVGEVLL